MSDRYYCPACGRVGLWLMPSDSCGACGRSPILDMPYKRGVVLPGFEIWHPTAILIEVPDLEADPPTVVTLGEP